MDNVTVKSIGDIEIRYADQSGVSIYRTSLQNGAFTATGIHMNLDQFDKFMQAIQELNGKSGFGKYVQATKSL
jgi:hypothetical protein